MTESDITSNENILIESIKAIIIESRKNLVRTVNALCLLERRKAHYRK